MVQKAYEFRLYPTDEQKLQISKTIGSSRYVYNGFLAQRKELYATEKLNLTYNQCSARLTTLKQDDETCWLKEVDKFALQNSLKDLDRAYKNFFEGRAKFPCFKKKYGSTRSYRTNYTNNNIRVNFDCHALKLPKLEWTSFRCSKKWTALPGKIINVTVRQAPSGKYFASVLCDAEVQVYVSVTARVGIDLGLKEFAITSSGEHVPNPKFFRESERKLAKLQRTLSRTEKGSKNRTKARIKVARQHERITNQRNDFLHKYSHKVVSENQVIVLEGLRVKNMIKNRRLAKSIQDAGWSRFREFIEYKARWHGRTYVEVDTFFPSSKLCSVCGTKNRRLTLDSRSWQCPECLTVHDRDENASQNILNEGLRLLSAAV